jgi:glutamate N-acetyltransferase/amino-acid N-acetyltransferase
VFTRSSVKGDAVLVSQKHLASGPIGAVVINSGVANVAMGRQGRADAEAMCAATAAAAGLKVQQVLVASTGIIGRPLPMDKIVPGIHRLAETLDEGEEADAGVARAILTTDLRAKASLKRATIGDRGVSTVSVGGIAKGSGMIAPNMATMLAFLTTDAAIAAGPLQTALSMANEQTFNRISVDGDTSTSDTVMLIASGAAGSEPIKKASGASFDGFVEALTGVCHDLAQQIMRDGEGATRLFDVAVRGAEDDADARRIGRAVINSPLVKTAVHGGDPNWGRLLAAIGKSGAEVRLDKLIVRIGEQAVYEAGEPVEMTHTMTRSLEQLMRQDRVTFVIDLGLGDAGGTWTGCDLSRDYVRINAEYTT